MIKPLDSFMNLGMLAAHRQESLPKVNGYWRVSALNAHSSALSQLKKR
jgi:hypothetical protein